MCTKVLLRSLRLSLLSENKKFVPTVRVRVPYPHPCTREKKSPNVCFFIVQGQIYNERYIEIYICSDCMMDINGL